MSADSTVPSAAQQNIEAVSALERDFTHDRTASQRIADGIGQFSGTIVFAALHIVLISGWIAANLLSIPHVPHFDPYPFVLLGTLVSIESVLLATFVLMMQNRIQQRADERAHLNLQIDLLAEREITMILQTQQLICKHLGIEPPCRMS
ncbi:MAG: DUF1003 domain-containing protein [Acidobacteriales bacterium]|nr:DUF1003 domain-containing protein [Terriglobales bacterium]